jgi:hypothetical protein
MYKEQLKTKVEALEANVEVKRDELGVAMSEAQVAREELANAGKPKLSADRASDLVDLLQGMFHDILNDFDTSDLDVEFGIGYDNRIELENVDMSAIEVHSCDIETVLEQIFCIVADEKSDNS